MKIPLFGVEAPLWGEIIIWGKKLQIYLAFIKRCENSTPVTQFTIFMPFFAPLLNLGIFRKIIEFSAQITINGPL
jgi:hypothetical protein